MPIESLNLEGTLMPLQTPSQTYTPEEYLVLEEVAECRHEYRDGEIVPMTGGSLNHNELTGMLCALLRFALRGSGCRVFASDLRVWIPECSLYTYPDVMIIQGEPALQDGRTDTVLNPLLVLEVLSKSTRNYDRGDKFACYRTIPELREYVLVDQYAMHVEQFAKNEGDQWVLTELDGPDAVLAFSAVAVQIPLSDLYENVQIG